MRKNLILDLADCTEFRQTLQARPPRIVHGTALLLATLLGTALLWAASLQLCAATPNCVTFEFSQAYFPLLYDLLTTPVRVDPDGWVSIPDGPGLGVELQPEAELRKKYPFAPGGAFAAPR